MDLFGNTKMCGLPRGYRYLSDESRWARKEAKFSSSLNSVIDYRDFFVMFIN